MQHVADDPSNQSCGRQVGFVGQFCMQSDGACFGIVLTWQTAKPFTGAAASATAAAFFERLKLCFNLDAADIMSQMLAYESNHLIQ